MAHCVAVPGDRIGNEGQKFADPRYAKLLDERQRETEREKGKEARKRREEERMRRIRVGGV